MTRKISLQDILNSSALFRLKQFKIFDYLIGGLVAFLLPSLQNKKLSLEAKRILIIRPGGLGDAVFLLPILKVLKIKGFIVDILCEGRNSEIFTSQNNLLNKVYLYEEQLLDVFHKSYDVVIDTEQWHYLSAIVSYFLKAEYRIGFATRPLRAKLFNKQVVYGENDYELDNFKKLFEDLLVSDNEINNINGCFDIPVDLKQWASKQIPQKAASVFLGSSITIRRLNEDQLLMIIRDLLANNYYPVLLGGKDVVGNSQQVLKNFKDQRVFNFVGKISLIQSAALIQRSCKFIGPDSGLMHLACAVGIPVVAVFGPGNLQKWGPKGNADRIITENASCSPCTIFGYTLPTCHGSYHCMKKLQIDKSTMDLNEKV